MIRKVAIIVGVLVVLAAVPAVALAAPVARHTELLR
jgi:hypothetical protein